LPNPPEKSNAWESRTFGKMVMGKLEARLENIVGQLLQGYLATISPVILCLTLHQFQDGKAQLASFALMVASGVDLFVYLLVNLTRPYRDNLVAARTERSLFIMLRCYERTHWQGIDYRCDY
jgi:hypothetical protein